MPAFKTKLPFNDSELNGNYHLLTEELTSLYVRENGKAALLGYTDAVIDMTMLVTEIARKNRDPESLQAALSALIHERETFVERAVDTFKL